MQKQSLKMHLGIEKNTSVLSPKAALVSKPVKQLFHALQKHPEQEILGEQRLKWTVQ